MNEFFNLITSKEAGNFGDFLSGLAIAFIVLAYFLQRRQKGVADFTQKISNTFLYGRKIREFYENFGFYLFKRFLESFLNREEVNSLKVFVDGETVEGTGVIVKTQQKAFEFFLLLQEIMYALKKNSLVNYIDEEELGRILRSYSIQIKEFFSVVDILVAENRKNGNQDGWGIIREEDFITLKNFFQTKYGFLK